MGRILKSAVVLVALFATAATASAAAIRWKTHPDGKFHDYLLVTAFQGTWEQATQHLGQSAGSWHLATITSFAEQQFLANEVLPPSGGEFWLGGLQAADGSEPDGGWGWVTGEDWAGAPYFDWGWAPNEPNQWQGTHEDFLGIWSRPEWDWGWRWNDEHGNANITGYLAEREVLSNPEPGTMILLGSGLIGVAGFCRRRMKTHP